MTETPPHTPAKITYMTLLYIGDRYTSKVTPITLVNNETEANALRVLIERTGAKVEVIDVPIWPNLKEEE